MNWDVVLSPNAEAELLSISTRYADAQQGLDDNFLAEFARVIERISP